MSTPRPLSHETRHVIDALFNVASSAHLCWAIAREATAARCSVEPEDLAFALRAVYSLAPAYTSVYVDTPAASCSKIDWYAVARSVLADYASSAVDQTA